MWSDVCGVFAIYNMFVRKSLAEMMAFEQRPKEKEEPSRQREQQVPKAGDGSKPERREGAAGPEGMCGGKGTNRSEVVGPGHVACRRAL